MYIPNGVFSFVIMRVGKTGLHAAIEEHDCDGEEGEADKFGEVFEEDFFVFCFHW